MLRIPASFASKFLLHDIAGQGSFARVYKASCVHSGVVVALKCIHEHVYSEHEAETLSLLQTHEHIVQYLHRYFDSSLWAEPYYALCMEYIPLDLCTFMNDQLPYRKDAVARAQYCELARHLFSGLSHIHRFQIIHRDIKPSNLLVKVHLNGTWTLKITDFGVSRKLDCPVDIHDSAYRPKPSFFNGVAAECLTEQAGSLWYRSPEVLLHSRSLKKGADGRPMYSYASDLWSAGCICAELLLCFLPPSERRTLFFERLAALPENKDLKYCLPLFGEIPDERHQGLLSDHQLNVIFRILGTEKILAWDRLNMYGGKANIAHQENLLGNFFSTTKYAKRQGIVKCLAFVVQDLLQFDPLARLSAQNAEKMMQCL